MLNAFRHHRVLRNRSQLRKRWAEECSTPFGITGCYARQRIRSLFNCLVLNAFRHHRVLRSCSWTCWPPIICAQRLSASQGATHPLGRSLSSVPWCAQRLSASQGATPVLAHAEGRDFGMCSTPFGITGCYAHGGLVDLGEVELVLNAFRHHRVLRAMIYGYLLWIIGVLNAFRHHRVLRRQRWRMRRPRTRCAQRLSASQGATQEPYRDPFGNWTCSTPFGITGCYAQGIGGKASIEFIVLNAFRHHRVLRTSYLLLTRCCIVGAQRLSASQGATRAGGRAGSHRDTVLNAFRHHRVLRLQSVCRPAPYPSVLNAFRHHRVLRSRLITDCFQGTNTSMDHGPR